MKIIVEDKSQRIPTAGEYVLLKNHQVCLVTVDINLVCLSGDSIGNLINLMESNKEFSNIKKNI